MKLSEAIRLGASTTKQAFGALAIGRGCSGIKTCALGSALHSVGKLDDFAHNYRPYLLHTASVPNYVLAARYLSIPFAEQLGVHVACPDEIDCPHDGEIAGTTFEMIVHLNDTHRWSREEIANWVERLERTDPAMAEAVRKDQSTSEAAEEIAKKPESAVHSEAIGV